MPKEIHSYLDPNTSVEDLLANVDQFVEGVYRDLNLISPAVRTHENTNRLETRRSLNRSPSPNDSPVGDTRLSFPLSDEENRNIVSPSTRIKMEAEIDRINRMCDSVDKNLRSIGVFMSNSNNSNSTADRPSISITTTSPTSTNLMSGLSLDSPRQRTTESSASSETTVTEIPAPIIDLSETPSQTSLLLDNINERNINNNNADDDDVIIVSANINPVVDLCTPGSPKNTSKQRRRRRVTRLPIQPFPVNDVEIVDTFDFEGDSIARKRRAEDKRKSLNTSNTETENNNSASAGNNKASGPIPYMCSVCMESCLPRQPTSTKCGHIFCNECIRQAIQITHKCPMCNTRISRNHIFRIYP